MEAARAGLCVLKEYDLRYPKSVLSYPTYRYLSEGVVDEILLSE